jgi:predicted nucleotidyltransferase
MKQKVPHLLLAVDFGASATKAIGSLVGTEDCITLAMSPHCVEVDDRSLLTPDPDFGEHQSWVTIEGKSYALGNLATTKFNSSLKVKPLKFTSAVQKACAVISIFAQKFRLPERFELSLTFVLPPAEWDHKQTIAARLKAAVKDLITPRGRIKPKLLSLSPFPEGMGVLLGQELNLKEIATITVVMVGFRNTSIFMANYGSVNGSQTSDLGFHNLLKEIAGKTGYRIEDLIEPVFNYTYFKKQTAKYTQQIVDCEQSLRDFSGFNYSHREQSKLELELSNQNFTEVKVESELVFNSLLKNSGEDRSSEVDMLIKVIEKEQIVYLIKVKDWLDETILSGSDLILIGGGTVEYLGEDFKAFLQTKIVKEDRLKLRTNLAIDIPKSIEFKSVSKERFADIYSLWHWINSRLNSNLEVS